MRCLGGGDVIAALTMLLPSPSPLGACAPSSNALAAITPQVTRLNICLSPCLAGSTISAGVGCGLLTTSPSGVRCEKGGICAVLERIRSGNGGQSTVLPLAASLSKEPRHEGGGELLEANGAPSFRRSLAMRSLAIGTSIAACPHPRRAPSSLAPSYFCVRLGLKY